MLRWSMLGVSITLIVAFLACTGSSPPDPVLDEDGAACKEDEDCISRHCEAGLCCSHGTCCNEPGDCPAEFTVASLCNVEGSQTDCQGTAKEATCDDHVCGSRDVPDDRGCQGQSRDCGAYPGIACEGTLEDGVAQCATTCGACAGGYRCVAGECVPVAGSGQSCVGAGQGNCASADLKCQNGVCCAAGSETCCAAGSQCAGGLACNAQTFTCYTTCADGDASRCASPSTTYCAGNECVPRVANGTQCETDAQCSSGICECFSASCSTQRCRSAWCGTCEIAVDEATCIGGLGSPVSVPDPNPADHCQGSVVACFGGACKKLAGQDCGGNSECGDGACIHGDCAAPSPLGGQCDAGEGTADCRTGLTCAGGTCKVPDGTACTANTDCIGTSVCRVSNGTRTCGAANGVGGTCDAGDANADCQTGLACAGGTCKVPDGAGCTANTDCTGTSVCRVANGSRTCGAPNGVTGACDGGEGNADCQASLTCSSGTCRSAQGASCTASAQCVTNQCVDGVCCNTACSQGSCAACNLPGQVGTCAMPADDAACGTPSCTGFDTICRSYAPITTNRCQSLGACKQPSPTNCTVFNPHTGATCGQPCHRCDTSGTCAPTSAAAAATDCGACQKCSAGTCVYQTSTEDLKNECSATCGTGSCNGTGACSYYASGTTCTTSEGCTSVCNGSGTCNDTCTCSGGLCPGEAEDLGTACTIAPGEPGTRWRVCSMSCTVSTRCQ